MNLLNQKFIFGIVNNIFNIDDMCGFRAIVTDPNGEYFRNETGNQTQVDVVYTSPFYAQNGGGMISVPEVGSRVLILSVEDKYFYYISTIIKEPVNSMVGGDLDYTFIKDKYIFSERKIPQKIVFTNQYGNGFRISRKRLPHDPRDPTGFYDSVYTEMDSELGKYVRLDDSSEKDAIFIKNECADGITITGENGPPNGAPREITIDNKFSQYHITRNGSMNLWVMDGRDINIENESSGKFANLNASSINSSRFGNINLFSKVADINISSRGTSATSIFLTTRKARIEIKNDGGILINSVDAPINIQGNSIKLVADENIDIGAKNLNIKLSESFKVDATQKVSLKATGNLDMDGANINLNSGTSTNVTAPSRSNITLTKYKD